MHVEPFLVRERVDCVCPEENVKTELHFLDFSAISTHQQRNSRTNLLYNLQARASYIYSEK